MEWMQAAHADPTTLTAWILAGSSGERSIVFIAVALLGYCMWRYWPHPPEHHKLDYMARLHDFQSYAAYLETNHWRKQKERTWKRYNGMCFVCGATKNHITHHASYDNFPREKDSDLVAVCAACHSQIHAINRQDRIPLKQCHFVYKKRFQNHVSPKVQSKKKERV